MFVGHATVALAVVALGAYGFGWSERRALALGFVAALFATVPDIDMLYAVSGLAGLASFDAFALADGFWTASTAVHRSVTHSIVLAVPVAAGAALLAGGRRSQFAGLAGLGGLVVAVGAGTRPLSIVILSAFVLGAAGIGLLARRRFDLGPVPVFVAGSVGLISHPFGDLLTGTPPDFLYPFDVTLLASRVTLAQDPTLHLLGAFLVELTAIWLGLFAMLYLRDERIAAHLQPRALLGGVYALAVLFLPPPTLDVSYHFVFSVVSIGFVGAVPSPSTRLPLLTKVVTGMAAVTVGGLAYTLGYLIVL